MTRPVLKPQKKLIKEIIAPLVESILEKCDIKTALALIDEAKEGQLGKKKCIDMYGKYDSELLEALNGISRLYDEPEKMLRSTFGALTPSEEAFRDTFDIIINRLITLYRPDDQVNNREQKKLALIKQIRIKLVEYKDNRSSTLVKEIMALKKEAGIINTGDPSLWHHGLNLSNLDLSHLDLSSYAFKGVNFTNSNLSHTNFTKAFLARCIFDNCNLEMTNFYGANMIGEEVSFKNARALKTNFTGIQIERGSSWSIILNPESIINEIKNRGAIFIEETINYQPPLVNRPSNKKEHEFHPQKKEGKSPASEKNKNREDIMRENLKTMKCKINAHQFKCHGGGKKINDKLYSDAAAAILAIVDANLAKKALLPNDYYTVMATIKNQLREKRESTFGFFGLGSRDKSTVTLYNELFNDAHNAQTLRL